MTREIRTPKKNDGFYRIPPYPNPQEVTSIKKKIDDLRLRLKTNLPEREKEGIVEEIKKWIQLMSVFHNRRYNSVIRLSEREKEKRAGKDGGKDSKVYIYDRYVVKYLRDPNAASEATKEFYVKKYQLLKKLLGKYIPRSWFFLGERMGKGGKKQDAVITIQKRIHGKTFQELHREGFFNGDLVDYFVSILNKTPIKDLLKKIESLDDNELYSKKKLLILAKLVLANKDYHDAKNYFNTTKKLRNIEDSQDVFKMDIGGLSDQKITKLPVEKERDVLLGFKSPNVILDPDDEIFFIDFDLGFWNEDLEDTYNAIFRAIDN